MDMFIGQLGKVGWHGVSDGGGELQNVGWHGGLRRRHA